MPSVETINTLKAKKQRKRLFVMIGIVFFIILYSVIWYVLAGKVENTVARQLDRTQQGSVTILCENMRKAGYPLSIGISCDTFNVQEPLKGFAFSSEKLIAGAPVYLPNSLSLKIKAPVSLELPGLDSVSANWDHFSLETDLQNPVPNMAKLMIENLIVGKKADAGAVVEPSTAKFVRLDLDGLNTNLKGRLTFDELNLPFQVPNENTILPKLNGDIQWTLDNLADFFDEKLQYDLQNQNNYIARLRGHSGVLQHAKVDFASGGSVNISGPFSFDDDGFLNAKFEIAILDQAEMMRTTAALFPSQAKNLKTIFFALSAMPKNKDGAPVLPLLVRQGYARVGFINLGQIDPI